MVKLILPLLLLSQTLDHAGIGVEDVGQISTTVTNWGILSTTPMFVTPSLHWPAGAPFVHQYCYGLHLIVAKDGDVLTVANPLVHFSTDWEPEENFNEGNRSAVGIPWLSTSDDSTTWPGEVWPGPYRVNPITGDTVYGEFTSDRDIYASYNDGGKFGIRIEQLTYGYGRYYADDILFYRIFLENRSDTTLHDLYVGLFVAFRVDFDFEDLLYFEDLQEPAGQGDFLYYTDADGVPLPPWESVGMMGIGVVRTPDSLGITDFHWFTRTFSPVDDSVYWAVITSDTSFSGSRHYFHGSNFRIDDTPPDSAAAYNAILSSGPFDLEPGEKKEFAIFVTAGSDTSELFANARTAFKINRFEFQGPTAPPPPVLRYVVLKDRIRLYWGASPSETTPDPFTGEYDFEGYKVYRSEDGGVTWGKPITDENGNVVNYAPLAIFDRIDGIKGVDPAWPYQSLGGDFGVRYVYDDTSVVPGHTYYYTVTAYDRGNQNPDSLAPSLESRRGANRVKVSFFARPSGYVPGSVELINIGDPTTAEVSVEIIDPDSIKGDTFLLECSTDSIFFGHEDTGSLEDTVWKVEIPDTVPVESPLIDGFKIRISNSREGFMETGWSNPDVGFDWFVEDRGRGEAFHAGYGDAIFVVDSSGSFAKVLRPNSFRNDLPFVEVDTTYWIPIKGFAIFGNDTVQADTLYVVDPIYLGGIASPPRVSDTGWSLIPGGTSWVEDPRYRNLLPDQLGLSARHGDDSLIVFVRTLNPPDSSPPEEGDTFYIKLYKPLRSGVAIQLVSHPSYVARVDDPLVSVTVYPNPLVVRAGFGEEVHFRNLPPVAVIRIYTVTGEPVAVIRHNGGGEAVWDLKNRSGMDVSYGLYFYLIETPDGKKRKGKFGIVR